MNELFNVWVLWYSNKLSDSSLLWGIELFHWGRIGAIVTFVSGLFFIAEIIGPDKLQMWGKTLDGRPGLRILYQFGTYLMRSAAQLFNRLLMRNRGDVDSSYNSSNTIIIPDFTIQKVNVLAVIITLMLAFFILVAPVVQLLRDSFDNKLLVIFIYLILYVLFAILTVLIILVSLTLIGEVLTIIFISPVAWILQRPKLDRTLKIISFILFIIGSHFSILAN